MSSWVRRAETVAEDQQHEGTTRDLCPSKVVGSQQRYPKQPKMVQCIYVEVTKP